jgi:hypothetical protein
VVGRKVAVSMSETTEAETKAPLVLVVVLVPEEEVVPKRRT